MNREELIEKAAKALVDDAWQGNVESLSFGDLTHISEAVIAVFEEAHTPTDAYGPGGKHENCYFMEHSCTAANVSEPGKTDIPTDDELRREVERVQKAAWAEIHGQDCRRQYSVAEVKRLVYSFDNLLGSLLHRTVQGDAKLPGNSEQGEPSDAEVRAGALAMYGLAPQLSMSGARDLARVAMRAAAAVRGGEQ